MAAPGRGRGMTLPAWMQQGGVPAGAATAGGPGPLPGAGAPGRGAPMGGGPGPGRGSDVAPGGMVPPPPPPRGGPSQFSGFGGPGAMPQMGRGGPGGPPMGFPQQSAPPMQFGGAQQFNMTQPGMGRGGPAGPGAAQAQNGGAGAPFAGSRGYPAPVGGAGSGPAFGRGAPVGGMPTPVPAASAPASGSSRDWTEHTAPDGRKYYFNRVTKVSAWVKPAELEVASDVPPTVWRECTADTGQKYYYNNISHESVWTMPEDYKAYKEAVERKAKEKAIAERVKEDGDAPSRAKEEDVERARLATPMASEIHTTPGDGRGVLEKKEKKYATKEEAQFAFKDLLEEAGIPSTANWEQAMRKIIHDDRYKAIRSLQERKQLFQEYLTKRKNSDREEKRLAQKKLRDDFLEMLRDKCPVGCSYSKMEELCSLDPRYSGFDDDRHREDVFDDCMGEIERKDKERRKKERKENMDKLTEMLNQMNTVTVDTTWRDIQEDLEENPVFKALEKADRLTVFQDHIKKLERQDEERRQKDRDEARRRERKNRETFRRLLKEKKDAGLITASTKWKDFCKTIAEDESYVEMLGQSGSTPKELFDDVVDEMTKAVRDDSRKIRNKLDDAHFKFTSETSYEDFEKALREEKDFDKFSAISLRAAFDELLDKAKRKDKERAEKDAKDKERKDKEKRRKEESRRSPATESMSGDDKDKKSRKDKDKDKDKDKKEKRKDKEKRKSKREHSSEESDAERRKSKHKRKRGSESDDEEHKKKKRKKEKDDKP